MRHHLFPFTRFAMHTLELVRRGCCITLQPSHAPVSPGSMVAMDCIMRQRVEQIHTLHAAALLFHDCFSSAQPGSSCSHHLLSSMHRRLQLHSSSFSCRSRATLVRFFRDCFMPVALQLEATCSLCGCRVPWLRPDSCGARRQGKQACARASQDVRR